MTTTELPPVTALVVEAPACPFCAAPLPPERAFCATCGQPGALLSEGATLKKSYTILGLLATSATGAVYQAQQSRRKGELAIKELLAPAGSSAAERIALAERFAREVRILGRLKHPSLPVVLDSFSQEGRHYMVMPLLPGRDLQAAMAERGQPFPERQVRTWGLQLLGLLDYLRQQHPPFVHGELIPMHLMLQEDGTPCLVGYGLAWRLGLRPQALLPGMAEGPSGQGARARGGLLGRLRGGKPAPTGRSATSADDLYGLGATLHSLLTTHDVYAGSGDPMVPFPPVRDLAPWVSVGVAEAVSRTITSDPRRRFPTTAALRAALLQSLATAPRAQGMAGPRPAVTAPDAERGGGLRLLALVLLLLALSVGGSLIWYGQQHSTPSSSAKLPGEANPLVGGAVPTTDHTRALAESFGGTGTEWPVSGAQAFQDTAGLWLTNAGGVTPLKVTGTSYVTGPDGFVLRGTLLLAGGPGDASYGLVAADRAGSAWDNMALLVRGDGHWALERYAAGAVQNVSGWRATSAVRQGHNTPNDLELILVPGAHGRQGSFSVVINGVHVGQGIPAGASAPAGRVGLFAGPGAVVLADALSVAAPPPGHVAMEEHFLNNHRGWTLPGVAGATDPVRKGLLRLKSAPGQPWLLASARGFRPRAAATVDLAGMVRIQPAGASASPGGAGGLAFAALPGRTLAAVIGPDGRVSVVALTPGRVETLSGPVAGTPVHGGRGLSLLQVRLAFGADGTLGVRVFVDGDTVLTYSERRAGLAPWAGLALTGPGVSLDAASLQVAE